MSLYLSWVANVADKHNARAKTSRCFIFYGFSSHSKNEKQTSNNEHNQVSSKQKSIPCSPYRFLILPSLFQPIELFFSNKTQSHYNLACYYVLRTDVSYFDQYLFLDRSPPLIRLIFLLRNQYGSLLNESDNVQPNICFKNKYVLDSKQVRTGIH